MQYEFHATDFRCDIGPPISLCHLKACVKVCVRELAKRDPSFADTLKKKTYAKLGRDHLDLRAVRPCPVPLVIVGNKYDIFKVSTAVFHGFPPAKI